MRIWFENVEPIEFQNFVTGLLTDAGTARFGRPVGLAVEPDGLLLFTMIPTA